MLTDQNQIKNRQILPPIKNGKRNQVLEDTNDFIKAKQDSQNVRSNDHICSSMSQQRFQQHSGYRIAPETVQNLPFIEQLHISSKICYILMTIFLASTISLITAILTQNLLQKSSQLKIKAGQYDGLVLKRNFTQGNTIKISYRFILGVLSTNELSTNFISSLYKIKQKLFDENGTLIKQIPYDESDDIENIFRYGANEMSDNDTQGMTYEDNSDNITNHSFESEGLNENETNGSGYQKMSAVLSTYRFSLMNNGDIQFITFPFQIDKATLGLVRSFIEMFSPSLVKQLYTKGEVIKASKRVSHSSRILQANMSQNQTFQDDPSILKDTIEERQDFNNFQTDDQKTILTSNRKTTSSGPTHNSQEESSSRNQFSNQGEIKSASVQAKTQFNSEHIPESQDYSVLNFDVNLSIVQKSEMTVLDSFQTNLTFIEDFDKILQKYESQNKTHSMNVTQLLDFIVKGNISQEDEPGSARILQEGENTLSIIFYEKNVDILATNVIGFSIKVYGYVIFHISVSQDIKDPIKKIPRIFAEGGTVINVGFIKQRIPVLSYNKYLPPLTLKFTLQKIQTVFDLYKSGFISKVGDLFEIILNGDFQNNLAPNILNVVSLIEDVDKAVRAQQGQNSPLATLTRIFRSVQNVKSIVDSKGLQLLNPQNQFSKNLISLLSKYYSQSFKDALSIFNQVKANFTEIKNFGSSFLQKNLMDFPEIDLQQVQRVMRSLIPEQIYEEYRKQMQKAKEIIKFFRFVRDNGLNYSAYIESALENHEGNLVQLVKKVVDLYFRNQTLITDSFSGIISNRFNEVDKGLKNYKQMIDDINVTNMENRSIELFNSLVFDDILGQSVYKAVSIKLAIINTYVNGISNEKAHCCSWKRVGLFRKKKCKRRNRGMEGQAAEPYHFRALRDVLNMSLISISQQTSQIVKGYKNVVDNPNITIVQKYFQLSQHVQSFANSFDTGMIDDLLSQVQKRFKNAQDARNQVGCPGTGNFDRYLRDLQEIRNFVIQFKNRFIELKNVSEDVIKRFDDKIYTAIKDNSQIIRNAQIFFNFYENYEQNSQILIKEIKQLTQVYDAKDFAKSSNIASKVFNLYGFIRQSLDIHCVRKEQNESFIGFIRQQYHAMFGRVQNLSNDFFQGELLKLKYFLNHSSQYFYDDYLQIPFCDMKTQFVNNISRLFPDFDNFTILYQLYKDFSEIKANTLISLGKLKQNFSSVEKIFFKLFTPQGYKQFISSVQKSAVDLKNLNTQVALKLSNIREQAKTIYMFGMAPTNQITTALNLFADSEYIQDSFEMFNNLVQMVDQSYRIVNLLSFDVIAFVVASQDVIEYFDQSVSNFKNGIPLILNMFKNISESFINIDHLVSQGFLNSINKNFRDIIVIFNQTIFPNISQNMKRIVNRYVNYNFTNQNLKLLFRNSMEKLVQFSNVLHNKKQEMFLKMQQFLNKAIALIENLEIGSLNSIFELTQTIRQEFNKFFSSFPNLLKEVLSFETLVSKDFRNVFNFKIFFSKIQKRIQERYIESISKINLKISETKMELQQNSKFYAKFQMSQVYHEINKTSFNFKINFLEIWSSADHEIQKIDEFLSELTGDVVQVLKDLNDAKQKMQEVRTSVLKRIQKMKSSYQEIRKKFFNIRSLVFISIKGDLNKTVTQALNSISNEINLIFEVDLQAIAQLESSPLKKIPHINDLIRKLQSGFKVLKQHKSNFISAISKGVSKIDQFIQDKLVSKFQNLKDATLYIQTLTNPENPVERIVLKRVTLANEKVPLINFVQPIPTIIGVFYITLRLDFSYGVNAQIVLTNFRSISFQLINTASLNVQVSFSYGIAMILEFGIYLRGSVLRGDLMPTIQLYGIIPYQLTKHILGITEITDQNKCMVILRTDLVLRAVQIEVGFYIAHIWIQLIWIKIKFCLNLGFFKFCISFRLPIGFYFTMKRHEWGSKFGGIVLAKKRLFQIVVIQFKY